MGRPKKAENERRSPFLSVEQAPKSRTALVQALADLFPASGSSQNHRSLSSLVHNQHALDSICAQAAARRVQALDFYKGYRTSLVPARRTLLERLLFQEPKEQAQTLVLHMDEPRQKWKVALQATAGMKDTVALGTNAKWIVRNLRGTLVDFEGSAGLGADNFEDGVAELVLSKTAFSGGGRERLAAWLLRRAGSAPFVLDEAVDVAEGRAVRMTGGVRLLDRNMFQLDDQGNITLQKANKKKGKQAVEAAAPNMAAALAPKMVLSAFATANAGPGGAAGVEVCKDFDTMRELGTRALLLRAPRVRLWHMVTLDRMTRPGYRGRRLLWGVSLTNEVSADLADFERVNYRKHSAAAQVTLGLGPRGALGSATRAVPFPVDLSLVCRAGTMRSLGRSGGAPSVYSSYVHGFETSRGALLRAITMNAARGETTGALSYATLNTTLNAVVPLPDKWRRAMPLNLLAHAFADFGTVAPSCTLPALGDSLRHALRATVGCGISLELGAGCIELSLCTPLRRQPQDETHTFNICAQPSAL